MFVYLATPDLWLERLYDRVADDLRAGQPLIVEVIVPLCDNAIIRCGGHGLGDGDDPERNLYWGTSGGFRGWFGRRGSGWTLVSADRPQLASVAEHRVWRRRVVPGAFWRRRGVTRPFDVLVDATAMRGSHIDEAASAFAGILYADSPHIVAWVGHNRWMDYVGWRWPAEVAGTRVKGFIALACMTQPHFAGVGGPGRVPLLTTTDFLFAGAHAFAGAVEAFAEGNGYRAIRDGAAQAYAAGERKPYARISYAFTNPSRK
jgi:hypothetical protein